MGGAEKLLGKGDALFYPVGAAKPVRVQCAFVSEKEIEKLVAFIKEQVPASFDNKIIKEIEQSVEIDEDAEVDELLNDAIRIVVESGQASILMLQRRLKIGYSRAARLIDQMEERRIIGGYEGSKPRKVLMSREDLED
jgi:S-DNA-T family DNA segregation ATPase FtsK/SpoIIIE